MRSSILKTMLMLGLMGSVGNKRVDYHNGNDSKRVDLKAEYELIKQKKSQLSSAMRKRVVYQYEKQLNTLK